MSYRHTAVLSALTLLACDDGDVRPEHRLAADPSSVAMQVRQQVAVAVRWVGEPMPNARLTWTATPDSIVTVVGNADGSATIMGQRAGATTVTASATDGRRVATATIPATVAPLACPLVGLVITPPTVALVVGGRAQVTVSLVPPPPCGSADGRVDFRIADPTVASVDTLGWITGLRIGLTTLQVSPRGNPGLTRATTVTVVGPGGPPLSVAVQPSAVEMAVGDTLRLQGMVSRPPNATNVSADVRFVSADTSVATVDAGGLLRGVKAGPTQIRAIAVADTNVWVAVPVVVRAR